MTADVLVAGIGNVLRGDDGFGVEVARRLGAADLPSGVRVTDYGIRGLHLALDLLDPPRLLVVADAVARGLTPGTVTLLRPDLDALEPAVEADGHAMDLSVVFRTLRAMGGTVPSTWIVACEPGGVEDRLGLSACVADAVAPAVELVRELVANSPSVRGDR